MIFCVVLEYIIDRSIEAEQSEEGSRAGRKGWSARAGGISPAFFEFMSGFILSIRRNRTDFGAALGKAVGKRLGKIAIAAIAIIGIWAFIKERFPYYMLLVEEFVFMLAGAFLSK